MTAILAPGGDTYTPSSGIWQTVWIETVPENYIEDLKISTDLNSATITTKTNGGSEV